ncbi:ABC transporter ATP-binding protein [Lachnoclostridium sp. An169]|uniref:ABC transporter ATP-binding protein n=1 Tax=Lachnoclostridium sp. An169 TaxID=1965569 RepID=UPI000B3A1AA4|nr:ABC transporter ATP-binding protein [Lachnoclostridium sp. An169]OUP80244.1 ABC transporter ATP-binding protein [Lachnoclostridium sp. An169]
MEAVVLDNLSKTYPGGKRAVQSVSLSLAPGEVFGFLGPNGAGKTSTVKMLNGILKPTEGGCRVFGYDPVKEPEKVHMISGIVTEHARMYDAMSGQDNLIFYAEVFGISGEEGKRRARELLEQMELTEAAERKLSAYSTGMRQRLSLARALLHHPRVLFLDEPTSGLDPESAQNVNRMIRSLAEKEGIAVFLCTHQLRYAQEICTRYGLIEEGRLLAEGTLEELRGKAFTESSVRIRTGQETMRLSIRSEKDIPGIVKQMVESGKDVYAVEEEVPTLEEIYFALTEGGKKQDE